MVGRMKTFTGTIQDTEGQLERAIDLPGWSHATPPYDNACSWYPFTAQYRRIYFKAKHRTEAASQCWRRDLLIRDLVEVR